MQSVRDMKILLKVKNNMNTIDTLNLLKTVFNMEKNKLVKENNDNSIKLDTPKEEFIRLCMIQHREGAITALNASIALIDNLIKCESEDMICAVV